MRYLWRSCGLWLAMWGLATATAQEFDASLPSVVNNYGANVAPSVPTVAPTAYQDPAFNPAQLTAYQPPVAVPPQALPPAPPPAPPAPPAVTYPNIKINGVFQADTGFFTQDNESLLNYGRIQDGAAFRRARLAASGSVTETVNYFFQMDFAFFGRPTFTDVWVEQKDLPLLGTVRIGQWKQPFSLEVVSSFRYTTFMERSVLFQPFTPFRHLGAGFYDNSEDLTRTWAASAFRSGQDQFGGSISTDGGWGTAERVTWCPYYDEPSGGRYYTHLGMGHFLSVPPNNVANFRTIPEFYVGENANGVVGTSGQAAPGAFNGTPFVVGTGPLANVAAFNVLGTELLWVNGPFSLQGEAMVNFVSRSVGSNLVFPGAYLQAGYFLTGEHRPYDRVAGAIDRIKPFENFFSVRTRDGICSGWGAWEVAGRASHLQLNSAGVHGGTITDFTAGLNWYWNPYTKVVFNYINSTTNNTVFNAMHTHIFGMRMQVDF